MTRDALFATQAMKACPPIGRIISITAVRKKTRAVTVQMTPPPQTMVIHLNYGLNSLTKPQLAKPCEYSYTWSPRQRFIQHGRESTDLHLDLMRLYFGDDTSPRLAQATEGQVFSLCHHLVYVANQGYITQSQLLLKSQRGGKGFRPSPTIFARNELAWNSVPRHRIESRYALNRPYIHSKLNMC